MKQTRKVTPHEVSRSGKPRVLVRGLTGSHGGLETFLLEQYRELRNDIDFWFLAYGSEVPYGADEITRGGGRICYVTPRSKNAVKNIADLVSLLRRGKFNAVWLNQSGIRALEPLVLAWVMRVPVRALHAHSSSNMGTKTQGLAHRILRPLALRTANTYLACSSSAAKWFFGDRNALVVPNSFNVRAFDYSAHSRELLRSEFAIDRRTPLIAQVGALRPEKNHSFSLEVLAALHHEGIRAILVFAGAGPLQPELESKSAKLGIADSVIFLGSTGSVPALLSASDLALQPSIFEGLPYAVLEAQASGLPCLISDTISPEVVVSDKTQRLPLGDASEWASAAKQKLMSLDGRRSNEVMDTRFDSAQSASYLRRLLLQGQ
ncbi:MAG: glycosyltransferase [Scrofimicrobium sp.]